MIRLALLAAAAGAAAVVAWALLRRGSAASPNAEAEGSGDAVDEGDGFDRLRRTTLLIEDNAWDGFRIDGIAEDWARHAAQPVRGFCSIPAGRHRIEATLDGAVTGLDFIIHPGELVVRRLDAVRGAFVPLSQAALAPLTALAAGGEAGGLADALVRYRSVLGIARVQSCATLTSPDELVREASEVLARLLDATASDVPLRSLVAEAAQMGERLVGVPLLGSQLETLEQLVMRHPGAERALAVGRAMLPENSSFEGSAKERS